MLSASAVGSTHWAARLTQALVLGLLAAIILTATSGEAGSTWVKVAGPTVASGLYLWLGRSAGWWTLPVATVALIVVGASASALFYDDQSDVPPDRRLSGMDQIGVDPGSVTILLPYVWVLLVLAILSRQWPKTSPT